MSAIKDARYTVTLDKERHLYFSLYVMDEMQDKFGGFDKLDQAMKGKQALENVCWILTRLLNEGAALTAFLESGDISKAEKIDERIVKLLVNPSNINEMKTAIFKAFSLGNSGTAEPPARDDEEEEEEEEDDGEDNENGKNAAAGKE